MSKVIGMDMKAFSTEQLAGQRLMVGFDGPDFSDDLKYLIDRLQVGGIILFAQNVKSPEQLRELCTAVQNYAAATGRPPLFIAIDQEGGQVARLKAPFTQFPGNPNMSGEEDAIHFAEVTAAELSQAGINMNLAPVMDVAPQNINSIMAARSFGHDPAWVTRLGIKVIDHLQQNQIMAVAKHFPGIGRTVLDSHLDLPNLDAELAELQSFDLIPFEASIARNVSGILLSHILYQNIDPRWPASLSQRIAKDLLRDQLGFAGVTLTDDLDMGAIVKHYDIQTIVRQVLEAEIDIVMICHQGPNIELAFEEMVKHFTDSPELNQKAIASARRILGLKQKYIGLKGSGFKGSEVLG
jgi:beta-N-acetylhexosaminidase